MLLLRAAHGRQRVRRLRPSHSTCPLNRASFRDPNRISAGRRLAIDLHRGHEVPIRPYTVGLVLWKSRHEQVWGQVPARCSADTPLIVRPSQRRRRDPPPQPRVTDWLITSHRIAGRFYPDALSWWEWTTIVGVQVDLMAGSEYVQLDLALPAHPVGWYGPGIAPLAVAAVYDLHGPAALLDHPGLSTLRRDLADQPRIAP
jgi:hypothetical protein